MRSNSKPEHAIEADRSATLQGIPELSVCDDAELRRIDDLGVEVSRPAGTVLQVAGHNLRQALVVLAGEVVERCSPERSVACGPLIGSSLLRGDRRAAATVIASSDVRLLVFGLSEMVELEAMAGIRAWADGARVPPSPPNTAARDLRPATVAGAAPVMA